MPADSESESDPGPGPGPGPGSAPSPPALPPLPPRPLHPPALPLDARRLHALFDILTHYETYDEIQSFKDPETIYNYGYPFVKKTVGSGSGSSSSSTATEDNVPAAAYAAQSDAPLLHMLFNKGVLSLPPAKTLPPAFWRVRVQTLMAQLAEAELSESYDQGAMGSRKILATAASALIESLSRGALGGYPVRRVSGSGSGSGSGNGNGTDAAAAAAAAAGRIAGKTYDTANAADFSNAWDDVLRAMVYGDLVDELFTFCAEHENIEEHSPAVHAAVDYIIIHLAEFLHYVFVLSPNGRYLTKLADSIQQLVPYTLIRQTLRVSNAATMINGMMKLLLAKLSVGGLTNWMGLTTAANDGMNLLQRIISLVLAYDASNFKKAADKIEKAKDGPSKAQLNAIKEHLARPRQYHDAVRRDSITRRQSMVVAILDSVDPQLVRGLTEAQHAQCAQYYAALLSVHDRRALTDVFCRQNPDLFTQALRDGVAALDPIIRRIHDQIDLKEHVADAEAFIDAFIEVSRGVNVNVNSNGTGTGNSDGGDGTTAKTALPTVKDYVVLLREHRQLLFKWLHRVATETPDIRDMFRAWAVDTIKVFRGPPVSEEGDNETTTADNAAAAETTPSSSAPASGARSAGTMDGELTRLFAALPADVQSALVPQIDAHMAYLDALDEAAAVQKQALLDAVYAPAAAGDGSGDDDNPPDSDDNSNNKNVKKVAGSGRFIARWQELLDNTLVGPATAAGGALRHGRDVVHITAPGKTGVDGRGVKQRGKGKTTHTDGRKSGPSSARSSRRPSPVRGLSQAQAQAQEAQQHGMTTTLQPPNVESVVQALGPPFRAFLMERSQGVHA
ncbi:px domain containing protein [Niveomyces insectorum RCEF 264]|uniref:Px domain containing protein n=1 Tax=Niveomyces insectorum RCEF 264 TaxID=1081102 RepID=A0A167YXV3_9HYPO|nr:px domain containing protein [Niveomyces insectorum RCEF 264]